MAQLDWVRKIYGDGMHCAFTDLVKWQDHYYCCFRHAERHAILPYGDVWIIRSPDLHKWALCGTITTGLDDRDPAMAADGDRLWVYCGSRYRQTDGTGQPVENGEQWTQSHASYTTDGTSWHVPMPVYERGCWLWHPYRFEDAFYCAAYTTDPERQNRVLDFLKSEDGLNWAKVTRMTDAGEGGETGLYRYDDGRILAAIRTPSATATHFMEAAPPYTEWSRWSVGHAMQAPNLARIGDLLIGAGRSFHGENPEDQDPARSRAHTSVYSVDPQNRTTAHLMDLPSGGDTSYCGFAVRGKRALLISYYSQHQHLDSPGFVRAQKPADIYLAQISF